MNVSSQSSSAGNTIRKVDIAEVSWNLQVRLGLAKLKYQQNRRHSLGFVQDECDKPSDPWFNFSCSHCETHSTSPALPASTYPRKLAVLNCDSHVTQPVLSASRQRHRPDFDPTLPIKAAVAPGQRPCRLKESSPINEHMGIRLNSIPVKFKVLVPDVLRCFEHVTSVTNSSPPPPSKQARLPLEDPALNEDKIGLPLYLSSSRHSVCVGGSQDLLLPCTPPSKYTTPATTNYSLRSPGQQFNIADFVNVTPGPAQPTWNSPIASG